MVRLPGAGRIDRDHRADSTRVLVHEQHPIGELDGFADSMGD